MGGRLSSPALLPVGPSDRLHPAGLSRGCFRRCLKVDDRPGETAPVVAVGRLDERKATADRLRGRRRRRRRGSAV
eukprot:COSAG06_NODE_12639_length_1349_cov_2.499200_1_plen_74_part_10